MMVVTDNKILVLIMGVRNLLAYILLNVLIILISNIPSYAEEVLDKNDGESCDAYYEQILPLVHPGPNNSDFTVYKRAEVALKHAIQGCTDHVGILTLMAQTKMARGNNTESYQYAKKAVELDASDWEANYILGQVLGLKGEYEQGLPYIKRSVTHAPDKYRHNVLFGYCSALETAGKCKQAVNVCTKVIKARGDGAAFYIRARAYEGVGDKKHAEQDFLEAKRLGFDGSPYYSVEHNKTTHIGCAPLIKN